MSFEQEAFVDYLATSFAGSLVEVGLSWKDNRVGAGYCDLASPDCVASGGAVAPELDIASGKFDEQLGKLGDWMQSYAAQLRFLVRVDYEVSPFMHCAPRDKDACPAYSAAFRHVRKLWQSAGISNFELVFHPTRGWAKQMYPGADVVDWIAFSVFNHDLCLPTPEGSNGACMPGEHLDPNLEQDLDWAQQQGKPLLIAEATVQKPNDESPAGFNDYLARLFELVDTRPEVRGVTYINMKWSGGWIYGEDWTQGAFGHVDARLSHFPETRKAFCDVLGQGRYLSVAGATLVCDLSPPSLPALPPDLDQPVVDRILALASNRCVAAQADASLTLVDCASSSNTGQSRFHFDGAAARLWSDLSWQCWSASGTRVIQQPCSQDAAQSFHTQPSGGDVKVLAADGRCVTAGSGTSSSEPLELASCADSPLQIFRL